MPVLPDAPPPAFYPGPWEEWLPGLPEASVEAVVTDPPYGTANPGKVQKLGGEIVPFDLEWDRELPVAWIPEAVRVLRPGGAFLGFTDRMDPKTLWEAMEAAGFQVWSTFYWCKQNPTPHPRKNFCSGIEVAVYGVRKGEKRLYWGGGGATPNYFHAPIEGGLERFRHPTQKPLSLLRHLVRLLVPPDGTLLDPFLGSWHLGRGRPAGGTALSRSGTGTGVPGDHPGTARPDRGTARGRLPAPAHRPEAPASGSYLR